MTRKIDAGTEVYIKVRLTVDVNETLQIIPVRLPNGKTMTVDRSWLTFPRSSTIKPGG